MHRRIPLILNTILVLVSIAAMVVSSVALPSRGEQSTDLLFNGTAPSTVWSIYITTPGTSYGSLWATLAASAIGVVAALTQYINIGGEDNPRGHAMCGAVVSGGTVTAALVAFVWSFVATYTSSRVYDGPFPETNIWHDPVGQRGTYSYESWNCQSVGLRYWKFGIRGRARSLCYLGVSRYHCSVF